MPDNNQQSSPVLGQDLLAQFHGDVWQRDLILPWQHWSSIRPRTCLKSRVSIHYRGLRSSPVRIISKMKRRSLAHRGYRRRIRSTEAAQIHQSAPNHFQVSIMMIIKSWFVSYIHSLMIYLNGWLSFGILGFRSDLGQAQDGRAMVRSPFCVPTRRRGSQGRGDSDSTRPSSSLYEHVPPFKSMLGTGSSTSGKKTRVR